MSIMHTYIILFASLVAGHFAGASKLPMQSFDNTLDNGIPINGPVRSGGPNYFVEIIDGPSPARHGFGEITELTCKANGHPTPRITWLKNDMPILEEELENNEIIEASDSSLASVVSKLLIIAVSARKEDVYTCVAESALKRAVASAPVYNDIDSIPPIFASVSSLNRDLMLSPRKPRITQHAANLLGDVGTTLVLPCKASGRPLPEITWHKKKGEPIIGNDRVRVLESGDLLFRETRWSDMGLYTCTAKNTFGKDSVDTFLYPVVSEKSKHMRGRQN